MIAKGFSRRCGWTIALALGVLAAVFAGDWIVGSHGAYAARGGGIGGGSQNQIPATSNDFFQPGTQPDPTGTEIVPIWHSSNCYSCHGAYLSDGSFAEPSDGWAASMMAQSARDPIWTAALTIANQDVAGSGEFCIRCHAPAAWLAGRGSTGDLSQFTYDDFDGVSCHFCHRMVNPVLDMGAPVQDAPILSMLDFPPTGHHGNAQYVIDPDSVRRGPYDDVPFNFHTPDEIIYSPFHRESAMCAACHDVSNPVFVRQPDGTYVLGALDEPHPTMDPHGMMPEQRTYSEWLHSDFAKGGVYFADGRFGGDHPTGVMQSCQDCHMPTNFTGGCFAWQSPPFFPREDLKQHNFAGANTWVLSAIFDEHPEWETGLSEQSVANAHQLTADLLQAAADMELDTVDGDLRVRIINQSGHKLPTGYPEGRRMWVNVKFFDEQKMLIDERGAYDFNTAVLTTGDTKVYETKLGMDQAVADATGLQPGASFHLVLNNVVLLDNRIPPIGFTNAAFEAIRAAPVGYSYDDGQHWDDTLYDIPAGAASAVATLYYQTTSREYIEFLRDANVTDNAGQYAYDLWVAYGKSEPLDMVSMLIELDDAVLGDLNGSGSVDVFDLLILLGEWGMCPVEGDCSADLNGSGAVDVFDLLILLANWG